MKKSSGILVYRKRNNQIEVFLVHPGGPFWKNKDLNSWSIPKGEIENNNFLENALREFHEETGIDLSQEKEKIKYLGEVKSKNKILYVYFLQKDLGEVKVKSNLIEIEYQGRKIKIPEVDQGNYFDIETAKKKLVDYQKEIIDLLKQIIQE